MNLRNFWRIKFNLGISGLFMFGLFLVLSGILQTVKAAPGDLFVTTGGAGTNCTQTNPCVLTTASSQSVDGDTIYVAQGTYTGAGEAVISVSKSVTYFGGWDGSTTTPVVRDPEIFPTTLDGENARRVVFISGDISPKVDGFIITRGNASTAATAPGHGGGIYSILADPSITNNKITDNVAFTSATEWGNGGGIYFSNSNGIPRSADVSNNLIANNTASSNYLGNGGGIHVDFSRDIVIRDNTFQGNIAGSLFNGLGGGVAMFESSAMVTGNWIQDNLAAPENHGFGGGFYGQNGDITLSGNQVINNIAEFGAVTFLIRSNITVTNNMIAQNTGGGLYIKGSPSLPITGILAHNTIAQNGGNGLCAGCSSPGYATLTLTNNIITGHTTGILVYPEFEHERCNRLTHALLR